MRSRTSHTFKKHETVWILQDPIDEMNQDAVESDQVLLKSKWNKSIQGTWCICYDENSKLRNSFVVDLNADADTA